MLFHFAQRYRHRKNRFAAELQVLFKIVAECCHQNMFIGLRHPTAIDAFHIVVVNQRAQHRLYSGAPPLYQPPVVCFVGSELLMHLVV